MSVLDAGRMTEMGQAYVLTVCTLVMLVITHLLGCELWRRFQGR